MRQPLGGQKRIRGDAERGVMMKASPASAFEVVKAQLVLELLIVTLDPPAQHRELDQLGARLSRSKIRPG